MPQRTNTFQQVVRLVYELMAEGAAVEESVMLPDRETGEKREVDVLVTGNIVPGVPTRIQIETTAQARAVDVKWVETEIGLHKAVGTDQLILVPAAGFSKGARKKAEANGAIPVEPRDLTSEDHIGEIVNRLASVWPKTVALNPEAASATVIQPNGEEVEVTGLPPDVWIVTDDNRELASIKEEMDRRLNAELPNVMEMIGLSEIGGDVEAFFVLGMEDWRGEIDGEPFHACLRWQPEPDKDAELHPIVSIKITGKAAITVTEIRLTHKKLGEFSVAYGAGKIGDKDALFVATENETGGKGVLHIPEGNA